MAVEPMQRIQDRISELGSDTAALIEAVEKFLRENREQRKSVEEILREADKVLQQVRASSAIAIPEQKAEAVEQPRPDATGVPPEVKAEIDGLYDIAGRGEDIQASYRDLAKKYHPDISKHPAATAIIQYLNGVKSEIQMGSVTPTEAAQLPSGLPKDEQPAGEFTPKPTGETEATLPPPSEPVPAPEVEVQREESRADKLKRGARWLGQETKAQFYAWDNPHWSESMNKRTRQMEDAFLRGKWYNIFQMEDFRYDAKKPGLRERFRQKRKKFKENVKEGTKNFAIGAAKFTARNFVAKPAVFFGRPVVNKGKDVARWTGANVSGFVPERVKDRSKRLQKQSEKFYRRQLKGRIILTRRAYKKKKKEENEKAARGLVLRMFFKGLFDTAKGVVKAIGKTGTAISRAARARFVSSRVGQRVVNSRTAEYASQKSEQAAEIAERATQRVQEGGRNLYRSVRDARLTRLSVRGARATGRGVKAVARGTVRVATATGRVLRTGYRVTSSTARALPKGLLTSVGTAAIFGLNPTAMVLGGATGTALAAIQNMQSYNLRKWRMPNGTWKAQADLTSELQDQVKGMRNIYSNSQRLFRSINTGLTVASIAATVGLITGVNPLLAAGAGFAAGAGARFIWDSLIGKGVAQSLRGDSSMFAKLARIPGTRFMNRMIGGSWIGQQAQILKDEYDGDLDRYLRDSFTFYQGTGFLNVITVGGNYLGAVGYLQTTNALSRSAYALTGGAMGIPTASTEGLLTFGEAFQSFGNFGRYSAQTLRGFASGLIPRVNPATVGFTVGSILGFAVGAAFNLGTGIGAMVGAGVGAAVGGVAGIAIGSAVGTAIAASTSAIATTITGGLGALATPFFIALGTGFGTFLGQLLGQALGHYLIDVPLNGAINALMNASMMLFNLAGAFLNLANMAFRGINVSNVVPFMMSLIMLIGAMSTSSQQAMNNVPISNDVPEASTEYQQLELSHYGVRLIGFESIWTRQQTTSILNVLNDLGPDFMEKLNERELILVIGEKDYYFDSEVLIVSLSPGEVSYYKYVGPKLASKLRTLAKIANGDVNIATGRGYEGSYLNNSGIANL